VKQARARDGRWFRASVMALVLFGLVLPIAAGLWETARAAFGVLPALGEREMSLAPWRELLAIPGLATAVQMTLLTGTAATLGSFLLAVGLCAVLHRHWTPRAAGRLLTPFLAAPHAAVAIGLAFLLSPSGWVARLLAPAFGWAGPPAIVTVNDPWGATLVLGLMIKEVPFLVLVMLAALGQVAVREHVAAGRSLGYGPGAVWIRIILPQVWPLIRLPVMVVLAYSLSVVDMAIVLGPQTPPTLAVMLLRAFTSPDVTGLLPASAGALLQLLIVAVAFCGLWVLERLARVAGLWWLRRGGRGASAGSCLHLAMGAAVAIMVIGGLAMASLVIWSLAWRWSWPNPLPETWSLAAWSRPGTGWIDALGATLIAAVASSAVALAVALAWLEAEDRGRLPRARWAEALVYLPLLLPQIGFLYGLNIVFLRVGLSGGWLAVIWAHALFVFPYVMIALSDTWRALDPRLARAAGSLGAGPWRRFFAVKLPVLLRPILTAAAIGVAVSVAQYLPTLFMGAGRIATLTTEAVALSSSSDRRITAVFASLQAALPFAAYALAFLIPARIHRNRRQLSGATT
jgi:putative thiamine transport system permease protein